MRTVLPFEAKLIPAQAKCVFKGIIYDVYHWQQKLFDGTLQKFEMLRRPDSVTTIAVKDDKIVALREEQAYFGTFFSLPGGRHDDDSEDELSAAKRELKEETGMTFRRWRLLDATQRSARIESFVYVFLATEFDGRQTQKPDPGERISVKLCSFEEVKKHIGRTSFRAPAKEVFDRVNSLSELIDLPSYQGQKPALSGG